MPVGKLWRRSLSQPFRSPQLIRFEESTLPKVGDAYVGWEDWVRERVDRTEKYMGPGNQRTHRLISSNGDTY